MPGKLSPSPCLGTSLCAGAPATCLPSRAHTTRCRWAASRPATWAATCLVRWEGREERWPPSHSLFHTSGRPRTMDHTVREAQHELLVLDGQLDLCKRAQ